MPKASAHHVLPRRHTWIGEVPECVWRSEPLDFRARVWVQGSGFRTVSGSGVCFAPRIGGGAREFDMRSEGRGRERALAMRSSVEVGAMSGTKLRLYLPHIVSTSPPSSTGRSTCSNVSVPMSMAMAVRRRQWSGPAVKLTEGSTYHDEPTDAASDTVLPKLVDPALHECANPRRACVASALAGCGRRRQPRREAGGLRTADRGAEGRGWALIDKWWALLAGKICGGRMGRGKAAALLCAPTTEGGVCGERAGSHAAGGHGRAARGRRGARSKERRRAGRALAHSRGG